MKRIFIIVSLALCMTSCSDFLETTPRTQVSEEEFYQTEEEVNMGMYTIINDIQTRLLEVFSYASLMSDESETGGGIGEGVYKTKYDTFTFDASNSPGWWNEWDYGLYNGVTDANTLIDKLSQSSLDASFVNASMAEAKFYRALFYAYIFMGYEQAPLIKSRMETGEIFNVYKGTRDEIFDFMMEDLSDENIANLPDKNSFIHGRTNQDAARMLRTKLILFHHAQDLYPKALEDMRTIMGNGYELMKDYSKIWLKAGEFCSESIYEIEFTNDNQGEGNTVLCRALSGRDIVDPRSPEQGALIGGYGQCTMPQSIYDMFEEGDTRREGTVIDYREEARKVEALVAAGKLPAGSQFIVSEAQENFSALGHYKYHSRTEDTNEINPMDNCGNNFRFYRYSDVLLTAAELQVRINGTVDSEGQGWFNQVRDRAFQGTEHRINLIGLSQQEALDILFEERGYEFMDEMQRWFDIMRFDKGEEILGEKGWTEKYRYFPISNNEINASNGALTQNPGWAN